MNILQFAYGLEFDDNFSFDQETQAMLANLVIAIKQGHRMLSNELNPAQSKFNCKRLFVYRLEETRT